MAIAAGAPLRIWWFGAGHINFDSIQRRREKMNPGAANPSDEPF
ncbi:MAG: hypothetical protein ACFFED_00635 [Candidatus Thorarchaeota archaeon]